MFQAKLMKKLLDVSDAHHGNVELATTWSFYFEGERYFEGTRSWLTAGGIEKPFINAYRLFAKLGRQRLEARSDAAWPAGDLAGRPYGMPEEVDCLASLHPDGTVATLVWRHADDQYSADSAPAEVALRFTGLPAPSYALTEYRIDATHSNSHTVWQSLGEPQDPDESALGHIRARQGLETHGAPNRMTAPVSGELLHRTTLPLPSVSLVVLEPC